MVRLSRALITKLDKDNQWPFWVGEQREEKQDLGGCPDVFEQSSSGFGGNTRGKAPPDDNCYRPFADEIR